MKLLSEQGTLCAIYYQRAKAEQQQRPKKNNMTGCESALFELTS